MEKELYTLDEASRLTGRSPEDLRAAIKAGRLAAQMGDHIGDYLIRAIDLAPLRSRMPEEGERRDPYRVLIIDDEINFANIVKLELERDTRLTVRYASWGRDGVRLAAEFKPDLCLIDFMLPDTTGAEVLDRLRKLQETSSAKVVVYSAHTREAIAANPDLENRLQNLGADEFMSKSAGLRALLVKVYGLLGLDTKTKIMRRPGWTAK